MIDVIKRIKELMKKKVGLVMSYQHKPEYQQILFMIGSK